MWPELNRLLNTQQIDELGKAFLPELNAFTEIEKLDNGFVNSFKSVYLPLAKWIEVRHSSKPVIIGINGAQGSGKSTLCKLLQLILEKTFKKSVLHLSIDDLYLSKAKRMQLAQHQHPLFRVRGVPATHDVDLGLHILENIKNRSTESIQIPVFDKVVDDLLPEEQWITLKNKFDIVLFEGWCVGATPQTEAELMQPINMLEAESDKNANWRKHVNLQLSEQYKKLFSSIDYLIMLKIPDMESVFEWRNLQEIKLKKRTAHTQQVMSSKEIQKFVMYFERITRHCLVEMPGRADIVLALDKLHQIKNVSLNQQ
jgi:D-glycerate 3-kinase